MKIIFEKDCDKETLDAFEIYRQTESFIQKTLGTDEQVGGQHSHAWIVNHQDMKNPIDLFTMMASLASWGDWVPAGSHNDVNAYVFDCGKDGFYVFFASFNEVGAKAIKRAGTTMFRECLGS